MKIATLKQIAHQQMIEEMKNKPPTVLTAVKLRHKKLTSQDSRSASIEDRML